MSEIKGNSEENMLKKENRDLNLRVHYLEEVIIRYPDITVDAKSLLQQNIDLKVKNGVRQQDIDEVERLKKEILALSKKNKSLNLSLNIALQNDKEKYDELKKKNLEISELQQKTSEANESSIESKLAKMEELLNEQKEINEELGEKLFDFEIKLEAQKVINKRLKKDLKNEKEMHAATLLKLRENEDMVSEYQGEIIRRDYELALSIEEKLKDENAQQVGSSKPKGATKKKRKNSKS